MRVKDLTLVFVFSLWNFNPVYLMIVYVQVTRMISLGLNLVFVIFELLDFGQVWL